MANVKVTVPNNTNDKFQVMADPLEINFNVEGGQGGCFYVHRRDSKPLDLFTAPPDDVSLERYDVVSGGRSLTIRAGASGDYVFSVDSSAHTSPKPNDGEINVESVGPSQGANIHVSKFLGRDWHFLQHREDKQ